MAGSIKLARIWPCKKPPMSRMHFPFTHVKQMRRMHVGIGVLNAIQGKALRQYARPVCLHELTAAQPSTS